MRSTSILAAALLGLVALAHLLRIVLGIEVLVAGREVPMWMSAFGMVVPGALAVALWRDGRASGRPPKAEGIRS